MDKRTSNIYFTSFFYTICHNMFWYILCVILVICSGCKGYKTDIGGKLEKITSERFVTINQFPSSVSIQETPFNQVCTGVILNQYYILTSAHCFWDPLVDDKIEFLNIKSYFVVTGTHDVSRSWVYGNYHRIDKIIIPNGYFTKDNLDITVVKIVGRINLDGFIRKAAVFASLLQLSGNIKYNVTGWGAYDSMHHIKLSSSLLRLATFESSISDPTSDNFIGHGLDPVANICKGDSGAGAFLNDKLIGIAYRCRCIDSYGIKPFGKFINLLTPTSQSFISKILANKCPEKSVVVINKNVDWDPVLEKKIPLGNRTTYNVSGTGLKMCNIM